MRGEIKELNWLNVNLTEIPIDCLFLEQKIVDYRAKTGAGAYILTGWSRVKMERLHKIAHGRTTSAICLPKMIEILLDLWPDLVVLPPAGSQVEFYKKMIPLSALCGCQILPPSVAELQLHMFSLFRLWLQLQLYGMLPL